MIDSTSMEMETMDAAVARLERAGYADALRARPDGFLAVRTGRIHPPESLVVDEVVRFEGESDPADEAVLFALRSEDGSVRATYLGTYGPSADPVGGALIKRLDTEARRVGEAEGGSRLPRARVSDPSPTTGSGSAGSSSAPRP